MSFTVYILQSVKDGRYYVGSTENIKERLVKHNKGVVKSTKLFCPWKLIYTETFETKNEASRREFQIKAWKKRSAIERLLKVNNGPIV